MLDDWPIRFPGCEPVAHRLKEVFPSRWVRFHSLSGSKRYPDTEDEYAAVLARQNRVLDELAGSGASVVLLTTGYSGPPGATELSPDPTALGGFDPDAAPWRSIPMDDPDGGIWHVWAGERTWRPGALDPILRLVIDDEARNVMVVHPRCRWIFHPYDGGMDLILESPAARDRIRSSHADWLPPGPDGL